MHLVLKKKWCINGINHHLCLVPLISRLLLVILYLLYHNIINILCIIVANWCGSLARAPRAANTNVLVSTPRFSTRVKRMTAPLGA